MPEKKALVLLSGGLDSVTVLAKVIADGFSCYALSFDYQQRHSAELEAARRIALSYQVKAHQVIPIDLRAFGGSALTDDNIAVPAAGGDGIPLTYVPARNTIFLSLALGWAEVIGAQDVFIGVNAVDYSGYPDCRPAFIDAFEKMANLATRAGIEGNGFRIQTPLMKLSKPEIIRLGMSLMVDYGQTVSCYQADAEGRACGNCDSCALRAQGFYDAGVADQTIYQ